MSAVAIPSNRRWRPAGRTSPVPSGETPASSPARRSVGRHEHLHDLDPVVEGERRRYAPEERPDEVPVLRLVAVRRRLVGDDGHEAHLRVLLLDQILARIPDDLAAEEELEAGVERVPRHRVLGAEHLGREPQTGADEAPGRRRLADRGRPSGPRTRSSCSRNLPRAFSYSRPRCPSAPEVRRVLRARPLEARDVRRDAYRAEGFAWGRRAS